MANPLASLDLIAWLGYKLYRVMFKGVKVLYMSVVRKEWNTKHIEI